MSIGRWILLLMLDAPTVRNDCREEGCAYQVKCAAVNRARLRRRNGNDRTVWFLRLELQPVKGCIAAALAEQFVMAARLDCTPVLHNIDPVGMRYSVQPVRDRQCGSAFAEVFHGFAYLQFGFRVERSSRLVEQDDRRIFYERTCNGDPLPLPPRQLQAVFADRGIVSARACQDEIVGIGRPRSSDDLVLAGTGSAESNVFPDRTAEQKHLLADIGNVLAQRAAGNLRNILAVDCSQPALVLIESQKQIEHGRFSAP